MSTLQSHLNCLINTTTPQSHLDKITLVIYEMYHTITTSKLYICQIFRLLLYIHNIFNDVTFLGFSLVCVNTMNADVVHSCSLPPIVFHFLLREISSMD